MKISFLLTVLLDYAVLSMGFVRELAFFRPRNHTLSQKALAEKIATFDLQRYATRLHASVSIDSMIVPRMTV